MSSTLQIRGLPEDFDEDDVYTLCDEFGPVLHCKLISSGRRGAMVAMVQYEDDDSARAAIAELDGGEFEDGKLRVWWAQIDDDELGDDDDTVDIDLDDSEDDSSWISEASDFSIDDGDDAADWDRESAA